MDGLELLAEGHALSAAVDTAGFEVMCGFAKSNQAVSGCDSRRFVHQRCISDDAPVSPFKEFGVLPIFLLHLGREMVRREADADLSDNPIPQR